MEIIEHLLGICGEGHINIIQITMIATIIMVSVKHVVDRMA
tara:strand:- start:136 stop:258 length:123 start_codon:yes stop_codon:yes gene_type:complete